MISNDSFFYLFGVNGFDFFGIESVLIVCRKTLQIDKCIILFSIRNTETFQYK